MKKRPYILIIYLICIPLLILLLGELNNLSETFANQQHIIDQQQIDVTALFYTESEHALQASKNLVDSLSHVK